MVAVVVVLKVIINKVILVAHLLQINQNQYMLIVNQMMKIHLVQ